MSNYVILAAITSPKRNYIRPVFPAIGGYMKKKRIYEIIQIGNENDKPSKIYDWVIVLVILINVAILVLETFDRFKPYAGVMNQIENVTYIVLIIEYLLSIWTADIKYPECTPGQARIKFMLSYDGIVELLTVLPFFFLDGFIVFQMLRVVRIFHLFRINAAYDSFNVITSVLKAKRNQLVSSIFIILSLVLAASLCMYSVEHEVQPDVFRNAFSGIWWGVSTIFTVGYGDVYPVTVMGRALAVVITFLGVGAVAIPTGILSAGFVEKYNEMQRAGRERKVIRTSTVYIDDCSIYREKAVGRMYEEFGIIVTTIIRNGDVVIPTANTVIQIGDTAVYYCDIEEDY